MKKLLYLFLMLASVSLTACNNYLDIVPDERATEQDAFKDIEAAERFLYSCYSYMPNPNNATSSLDFMTGDEVYTAFEHETFANFPKGNFTSVSPVISYWNNLYGGIRQCYLLMANIDQVPGMDADSKKDYVAQAKFLIGYYHMLLFRCYGPTIVVRELPDVNVDPSSYLPRSTMKETVDFITQILDEAATDLPTKRSSYQVGLGTSTAAKALKAYTLLYYASPLFNGNADLASKLINKDGTKLMDDSADPARWAAAKTAYKDAVTTAEAAGFALFDTEEKEITNKYPTAQSLRILRANLVTPVKYNKEEIWTKDFDEGLYGLQKKNMPYVSGQCWNGVAPTLAMLNRFYTKNGLPYDVDPETKNLNRFSVVTFDNANANITFANNQTELIGEVGKKTSQMNLNREPRYYAWIAFQGGFFEVTRTEDKNQQPDTYKNANMDSEGKRMICNFLPGSNTGYAQDRGRNITKTGFLNKKGVNPDNVVAKNGIDVKKYPWPLIRLAELYLGYAEACVESGDLQEAKTYLNKVRTRAGIPTVDESWAIAGVTNLSQAQLREIVRQERQIELYLENHNFWDMRRWKLADKYFNVKPHGMDYKATSIEAFSRDTEIEDAVRSFTNAHWLLPIPSTDAFANQNVVQNPGY